MTSISKKRYTAPELTAVVVDREITLVMATEPVEEWPEFAPQAGKSSSKSTTIERTPFGSSTPDYSNMRK